jgi:Ca2+-transporting ATPase
MIARPRVTAVPAKTVATATGDLTEMGQVVQSRQRGKAAAHPAPVPKCNRWPKSWWRSACSSTAVLALGMVLQVPLHDAFLVGVAVALVAVPEGLAATVTIALSLWARAMTSRGAVVKRLSAVATLGGATVVASDKTGTLTENQLRVTAVRPAAGRTEKEVLAAALLASSADIVEEEERTRVLGDPVDGAIVLAARDTPPQLRPALQVRSRYGCRSAIPCRRWQ